MAAPKERRSHPRYALACRLRLELPGGRSVRARAVNISKGGVYFLVDRLPKVDAPLRVRLAVPRDTANTFFLEQVVAEAAVARRQAHEEAEGVALAFRKPLDVDLP